MTDRFFDPRMLEPKALSQEFGRYQPGIPFEYRSADFPQHQFHEPTWVMHKSGAPQYMPKSGGEFPVRDRPGRYRVDRSGDRIAGDDEQDCGDQVFRGYEAHKLLPAADASTEA